MTNTTTDGRARPASNTRTLWVIRNWQTNPYFRIGPNPSSGSATVFLNDPERLSTGAAICVHDATGRRILRKKLNGSQLEINLAQQRSGLYFISLEINGTIVATETAAVKIEN